MADRKLYVEGNQFRVVDVATGNIIGQDHASNVHISQETETGSTRYQVSSPRISDFTIPFAEIKDKNGDPYPSIEDWETFYTTQTGFNSASGGSEAIITGWSTYIDTQYVDASTAFTLTSNIDTVLPNNRGSLNESQKPSDITTFYDGSVITGRSGDNLDIMLYFKAVPSVNNQWIDVWIDIAGGVGELYRQTFTFPRGSGVERGILYGLPSSYTLGTWEANGGTVYIRSNDSVEIYAINFNFDRSHKAI